MWTGSCLTAAVFFQEEELLFLQLYTEMLYVNGNTKVYKTLTSIRELVPQP